MEGDLYKTMFKNKIDQRFWDSSLSYLSQVIFRRLYAPQGLAHIRERKYEDDFKYEDNLKYEDDLN